MFVLGIRFSLCKKYDAFILNNSLLGVYRFYYNLSDSKSSFVQGVFIKKIVTQLTFTCSKLTIEILEQGGNLFQVSN